MKRVIIAGAGASGLACMNVLNQSGLFDIIVLEEAKKAGRKILASGNGRCNISNTQMSIDYYNVNHPLIEHIISSFSPVDFFRSLKLKLRFEKNLIYPYSLSSLSVKNALTECMNDISYIDECSVINIKPGKEFIVETNQGSFSGDYVIIATGSPANNLSGNHNLDMLKSLKLNIIPFTPSLVQMKTKQVYKQVKGLRVKASVSLFDNKKHIDTKAGEVLFTDYGLSGICIMQLSRYLQTCKKPSLSINLLYDLDHDDLDIYGIDGLFHESLAKLLKEKHLNPYDMHFDILSTLGNDRAQVCHGGLSLEEVNNNLEVKKVPGLYVLGEALDVDGDCGGYNLHFAFGCGVHAAKAIIGEQECLK